MHTGMLWFDNSQGELEVKIQKACEYYEKKYGRKPDLVLAHPTTMGVGNWPKNIKTINGIEVTIRAYRPVLPGHIWVGIEDKEQS
jgi:hypothetical protein